jgi:hypothetical protein
MNALARERRIGMKQDRESTRPYVMANRKCNIEKTARWIRRKARRLEGGR